MDPVITEVPGSDPDLVATLAAAGLPTGDLAEPGRSFFRFEAPAGRLVGFIGWELAGEVALLRSLVVVPSRRGEGWSRAMTGWALTRLAELGATDACILTTTIAALAEKLGFARIDRALAPPEIRGSRQFGTLCPASAILLHRSLP
jgi:N-acetylglutamate synthase-like GNAT family acetyltransferase